MKENIVKNKQKNIVSLAVVVVLAVLMLMPVGSVKAWPMHDNFVNPSVDFNPDTMGNITLDDISAPPYYRVAFTDKDNQLRLDMENNGLFPALVQVDIYSVQPDGVTQTFLKTVNFGAIPGGHEKSRNAFLPWEDMWQPSERGRNWIHGEIFVKWMHNERINVGNFTQSFNVVPGDRPLLVLGPTTISEPTVWDNLTVIVNGDIVVNAPLTYRNTDVIGDDLIVKDKVDIGSDSSHDMNASTDGEFKVHVNTSGILNVYGKIWNNPQSAHYWFYMNGTLNVDGGAGGDNGVIENTYGPSDLSQPGGVICMNANGTVRITDGGTIRNSSSHGLYLYNTSAFLDNANISNNAGAGVYSVKSAPVIQNSIFEGDYWGVKLEDEAGSGIYVGGMPVYSPGVDLGYFIWWDEDGWHLRYSSDSEDHYFNGTIRTDSGIRTFGLTVSGGTEQEDNIGDYSSLTLDLWIDGVRQPDLVYIGEFGESPDSLPVELYRDTVLSALQISNDIYGLASRSSSAGIKDSTIRDCGYAYLSDGGITSVVQIGNGLDIEDSIITAEDNILFNTFSIDLRNSTGSISHDFFIIPHTVIPEAMTPQSASGIHISDSSDILISDSLLFGGFGTYHASGINVFSSSDISMANVTIASEGTHSIEIQGHTYTATRVDDGMILKEDGSVVYEYHSDPSRDSLLDHGITVSDSNEITVMESKIEGSAYGVETLNSTVNTSGSSFSRHWYNAISARDSIVSVWNNYLSSNPDNGTAIYVYNSSAKIAGGNDIAENYIGVSLVSTAFDNINYNNIERNKYAIFISASNNNLISNNTISNNTQKGLYLTSSSFNRIEGNNIAWNTYGGISLDGASHSNLILNNTVSHNQGGKGISSYNARGNTIEGNYISDNNQGVYLLNSDAAISENNITENYYAGIYLNDSSSEIYGNNISYNNADVSNPETDTGIHIVDSENVDVHDNTLLLNTVGIYCRNSRNITIERNLIAELTVGLDIGWGHQTTMGIYSISSQVEMSQNTIYGSDYSIKIENAGNDTLILNNTICPLSDNSLGAATVGIYLINASAVVESNIINASTGIRVENSTDVILRYNNASGCLMDGLYVYHSGTLIDGNDFWNNGMNGIYIAGGSTATLRYNDAFYNGNHDIYIKGQNDVSIEGNNNYGDLTISP